MRAREAFVCVAMLIGCGATGSQRPPSVAGASSEEDSMIGLGQVRGVLASPDPAAPRERSERAFAIDLEAGTPIRVRVPAGEIDPRVGVKGPPGSGVDVESDDVSADNLDALVDFVTPVSGRYRIVVSSAVEGRFGAFILEVSRLPDFAQGPRLHPGTREELSLGNALDPQLGPGLARAHVLLRGGEVARIRVTSTAFDTVLTVRSPSGATWVNDDAGELGTDGSERAVDSSVVLCAPVSGAYLIDVHAYRGRGAGAYRVAVETRDPVVVREGESAAPDGFAGPRGQGRVLGLFAGISDYSGELSDLYGAGDDAQFLALALRAARLSRVDEQIVLVDGAATRSAIFEGIRTLAARATPEDVVFVWWSGHGDVVPASGNELDGLDETITAIDGPIRDDELVDALSAVHAGLLVLALDSCHSGGFADDFVTAPSRVGLFSSDEDVLSDVAPARRAGGYLSWYLRMGVLGLADQKPRDGMLLVGELVDYLAHGYVESESELERGVGVGPMQHLVTRRGSVRWSDPLWIVPRDADLRLPPVPDIDLRSPPP